MKLLIPVAGKSSRYPGTRPKWLLTMPNGQLMIEKSISGLNLKFIDNLVLIMLDEHRKYIEPEIIKKSLEKISNLPVEIFLLNQTTFSQPSTIAKYLKYSNYEFEFFIKDSDNYFKFEPINGNNIAYIKLDKIDLVNAGAKSYISINNFDEVEQIAEKKVISDKFCCGGYGFSSSTEFLKTYEKLGGDSNKDLYISHIIQKQLLDGTTFHAYEANSYESYGTLGEFRSYSNNVKTIFCDFDGVLVKNSSKFQNPPWQYIPIEANLLYLSDFLLKSKDSKLIITTSRPLSEENKIILFLKKNKIPCHSVITGLPHSKRIIINDFSKTNPYPSCLAVNLVRDEDNLSEYI